MSHKPPSDQITKFRKGTPRSRNGCVVCKARHVKCDEAKPSCKTCLHSGWTCRYANLPPVKKLSQQRTIAPAVSTSKQPNILRYQPSIDIPGTHAERRSFHYIQAKNLTETFGRCEIDLWDVMILSFSHSHPAIRSSLLALSSIYETRERSIQQDDRSEINLGNLERYALLQYNNAVAQLVRYLGSAESDRRVVLMSCLIFTWVEMMLNNLETAFRHLNSGLNILKDMEPALERDPEGEDPDDTYGSIQRSFLRLRFQATLDLKASIQSKPAATEKFKSSSSPHLNIGKSSGSAYLPEVDTEEMLKAAGPTPSMTWVMKGRSEQLQRLEKADEIIKQKSALAIQEEDRRRSLTVLYIRLSQTVLSAMTQARKTEASNLPSTQYAKIVELVEDIYNRRKDMDAVPAPLDFAIIPPLSFTLVMCSDNLIRRRALDLLKAGPRREGLWHRDDVVAYIEGNMPLEIAQ